MTTVIP